MSAQRILGAAVTLVAVTAAVGCGGDGDSPATRPLSHGDYVTRANAACKDANAAMARLQVPRTLAGLATYADGARAVGEELERKLSGIVSPAADRGAFDRYRAALRDANRGLATMKAAAGESDREGVRTAVQRIAAAQVGILATQAGLGSCATSTGGAKAP